MPKKSKEEKIVEEIKKKRAKYKREWNRTLEVKARKYKIGFEDFINLLSKCAGRCDICGEPLSQKNYSIDHNHKNNKVRGILCRNCNTSLGFLKDSPSIVAEALKYLKDRSYSGSARKIRKKRPFGKKRTQEFRKYLEEWNETNSETPFLEKNKKR
tara:strand:+ start:1861 stop:2328 length:468 start_codon:yes stop_codon:yes gene_type:complete